MTNLDSAAAVLSRLRQLRAGSARHTPAAAWVEGCFPAAQLQLAIAGVGDLSVPASAGQWAALQARSQPAPFGLGKKTLVDVAVRDSGEIDAGALTLRWAAGAQAALCEQIAAGLGLPRVELKPHKLLSYGRGQFFKPHQDTARRPQMLGTLVLIWPSAHLGGELRIQHNRSTHRFRSQQLGQDREIRWCAFYADCRHEVLPVEEGQRLALSFEVLVPDAVAPAQSPADPLLCAALRVLFESSGAGQAVRQRPWLLLLDHQYSEHGLRWRALKSKDRQTALALRAATAALGYAIHLALIEQTEVWNCVDDQTDFDEWEDDGADEDADEDPADDLAALDPADLIDRAFTTVLWVDQDDEILSSQEMWIDEADVGCMRPTGRAHLVNQEYEGYMGNYGQTMNYWYRRAALVVQSPAVALRLRYEVDTASAIRELAGRAANPAQLEAVRAELHWVQDLLAKQLQSKPYELLPAVLHLAVSLSSAHAAQLLAPLHHAAFGLDDITALQRLQQTHGVTWLQTQLSVWSEQPDHVFQRPRSADPQGHGGAPPWPEPLDQFLLCCQTQGLHPNVIRQWQAALLAQFLRSQTVWQQLHPAQRRDTLSQSQRWLQRFLGALCVGGGTDTSTEHPLGGALRSISASSTYPLPIQVQLLCGVAASGGAGHPAALEWRTQLQDALAAALATPALAADDQSLRDIEWVCRCAICTPVIRWAQSPSAAPYRVAIAEQGRQHISERVQWSGAPISTQTIKQGRPYVLQCHKAVDAGQREAEQRQALKLAQTRLQALPQQR